VNPRYTHLIAIGLASVLELAGMVDAFAQSHQDIINRILDTLPQNGSIFEFPFLITGSSLARASSKESPFRIGRPAYCGSGYRTSDHRTGTTPWLTA
jgi:hypothetical protein